MADINSNELVSLSAQGVEALLPVQIDQNSDSYREYANTYYPGNSIKKSRLVEAGTGRQTKAATRLTERGHYFELISYLAEVSAHLNSVFAQLRYIVHEGQYLASPAPERDFAHNYRLLLASLDDAAISQAAKQFATIVGQGGSHVIRSSTKMKGGFDIIYSGVPGAAPGSSSGIFVKTNFERAPLPELKRDYDYGRISPSYSKPYGVLALNKGTLILKALMGKSTQAGSSITAHRRHTAQIPLDFDFKTTLDVMMNNTETKKVLGVATLADVSNFPTISPELFRSLGKFFSILVTVEPNNAQVTYAYQQLSKAQDTNAPTVEAQPVSDEYLILQPDINFSIVAHLPKDIAEYITQTTAGEQVPLTGLNTWASIWSRGLLRIPKAKGGIPVKGIPRYILPASSTAKLNAARKDLGFHAEEGRSNDDDIFVSNTGRLNYCPKTADLALDNANNYEKILEEALSITFAAGSPLNTNQVGETHKCFSLASPEYKEKIGALKTNIMKYSGCLQSYSWDYNCILTSSIGDPDKLIATNLSGTTRPDELGLADYLKKPFAISMALLFNQSIDPSTKKPVSSDTFGGGGQASPMLATSLFTNFFTLYAYLFQKSLVPNLQTLVTTAAKELGLTTLAPEELNEDHTNAALQYEVKIYEDFLMQDLTVQRRFITAGPTSASANMTVEGIRLLLDAALKDSYGAPRSNLAKMAVKTGIEVADDPHYFSPQHFTLAEFKNVYNYLGGRVFLNVLKALQKVPKKDLFVVDLNVDSKEMPNFRALVYEVMPMAYILGKYVLDSESIYEKAELLAEANTRDTSIGASDIHIAGTKEGFQMFPHQVEANQSLRGTPPRFAVLDVAPGGGKTALLLSDIACLVNDGLVRRPVVLAPNGLVRNWVEDMLKVTGGSWNMIPITTLTYRTWGDERLTRLISTAPRNTVVVVGFSATKLDAYSIVFGNHVEKVSGTLEFLKKFGFDYIAIDECLTGDSLIPTEKGLMHLKDIVPKMSVGEDAPCEIKVVTQEGVFKTATAFKRRKEAFKITTRYGYSIKGTSNHPVQVLREDLSLEWINVEDLQEGDYLCIQRKHSLFPELSCSILDFNGNKSSMSSDLARWLGYMVSEGHIGKYRIEFSNHDKQVLEDFAKLSAKLFPSVTTTTYATRVICNGKAIVEYLNYLGDSGKSGEKRIPWTIRQSSREHVVSFLKSLYEGDGGIDNKRVVYTSKSKKFIDELQVMLLNFGIISKVHKFKREERVSGLCRWYHLVIPSLYADIFENQIGFLSDRKKDLLSESADCSSKVTQDIVPYLNDYRIQLRNTYGFGNGTYRTRKGNMRLKVLPTDAGVNYAAVGYNSTQSGYAYLKAEVSRGHIKLLSEQEHRTLERLVDDNFFFDPIVSIKSVGVKTVYDIEVPGPHSFVANGIVVHNCHKLKNARSAIHKAVKQLCVSSSAKYVRLATGTLISNKLTDVVGQAAMFSSQIFRTADEYEDENMVRASPDSKAMVWKENTPALARAQLARHCAVVTFKRKEWAFMLPRPIETFIPVNLEKIDAEGGDAHQRMYQAILEDTLEAIKGDSKIQKLLEGKDDDSDDDDDEEDDDRSTKAKDGQEKLDALGMPTDLDDATMAELGTQLQPYLARLEQLLTDPLGDPFGEIYFEGISRENFVSNKVLKIIDRIRLNFIDYPWTKGKKYKLKDLADYDGLRYVLMGRKGERLTLESYEEEYTSTLPPNKDPRWQEESRGKVIVFCRYTRTVNAIYEHLPADLKKMAVKFHGEEKGKWANLEAFKSQPIDPKKGIQILIANEQAITEGHNLQCFPAQTQVMIDYKRSMSIEDIYNNPEITHVLSYNLNSRKIESRKITAKLRHKVKPDDVYLNIRVQDNRSAEASPLLLTHEHPVFLKDGSEVEARDLKVGDQLITYGGRFSPFHSCPETNSIISREDWNSYRSSNKPCSECGELMPAVAHFKHLYEEHGLGKKEYLERHACRSAASARRFEDPEYRAAHSICMKEIGNQPEERASRSVRGCLSWEGNEARRLNVSKKLKKFWKNASDDYKSAKKGKISAALLNFFSSDEGKLLIQDRWERYFEDAEAQERISTLRKEVNARPSVKKKISKASKAMWKNPEIRERMIAGMVTALATPEARQTKKEATAWCHANIPGYTEAGIGSMLRAQGNLPNRPERNVIGLEVDGLLYTGDGDYWVTLEFRGKTVNKNPDFISLNHLNEKGRTYKVLEVIGARTFTGRDKKYDKELIRAYKKVGIECLIVDAELCYKDDSLEYVKARLESFINNHYLTVTNISVGKSKKLIGDFKYDINVQKNHNFFACAGSSDRHNTLIPVLVHNCASRLVRCEAPWAPGDLDQSAARIFRPDPSHKFKRETIYLDWVLTNGTLEVSKLGRLISKMLIKTQFDEADNPLYDPLKEHQLPLLRMSLKAIAAIPSLNDIHDYIVAYQDMAHLQATEFEEMRQTKPSSMIAIEKTAMFADAAIIEHVPFVPDQEVPDRHNLGLVKLNDFLEDTASPEAVSIMEDKRGLIGRYVHTEFGNGVIINVGLTGNSNVPGKLRKLSRVSIHLASGDKYDCDAALVHLATNLTEDSVKEFTPDSPWATKSDKAKAVRLQRAVDRQALKDARHAAKSLKTENLARVRQEMFGKKPKVKRPKEEPEEVVSSVELYQVVYNGFLAVEAIPADPNDDILDDYGYHNFGDYAYIGVPTADAYDSILDYLEAKYTFTKDTVTRLNSISDVFKTRGKRSFAPELAPISEFKNFYTLRHRVSTVNKVTRKPDLKVYPVVMDGKLMLNIDLSTNPAIRKVIGKAIPGCPTKFDDVSGLSIKFFSTKTELVRHVKQLRADGIEISNYADLVDEVRAMNYRQGMV